VVETGYYDQFEMDALRRECSFVLPFMPLTQTGGRRPSAGGDVLLRQKSICDNQSHHAREINSAGRDFRIIGPVELRVAEGAG
jgi:hypothetical protein